MIEFIKLKDAVNNLYNNLIDAEITNYMETYEEDDPTKKSINQLKESNYKDLRILQDFITEKRGQENIKDILWEYIAEKDIPEIEKRLTEKEGEK